LKRSTIIFFCILVTIPLILAIYLGSSVIPHYMETKKEDLTQNNFFITSNQETIQNQKELIIARKYKAIFDELEGNFRKDLIELGQSAYQEYKNRKAEDPDFSPYSLAGKYLNTMNQLEEKYDNTFNNHMNGMEEELKANSLPTDQIEKAQYAYQENKEKIKQELLSVGKKLLQK